MALKSGLRGKQALFVKEYLKDRNATQAAIRAGYSKATAASMGSENLKKPEIRKAVAGATGQQFKRLEISADRVMQEIAGIAYTNIAGKDAPRVKTSDKVKSLEILAKHFKLMTDVHEVTGRDGGPQIVLHMPANGREAKEETKDGGEHTDGPALETTARDSGDESEPGF